MENTNWFHEQQFPYTSNPNTGSFLGFLCLPMKDKYLKKNKPKDLNYISIIIYI